MAPNGASSSRKTPASTSKTKSNSVFNLSLDDLFDEIGDATELREDVKKGLPVPEKPGNWDTKSTNGTAKYKEAREKAISQLNRVPSSLVKSFATGRLMDDKPILLKCNHCKRPVAKYAMPDHIQGCLNKKQEKQRRKKEAKDARDAAARKEKNTADSDDEDEAGKKLTAIKGGGLTASKKRKALDDAEEGNAQTKKKKKKEDPKAKAPRPKAPVDVEKQCGVELPQGGQCARSLTCKSHSMGAKRAVPGRSARYDTLLMEYQRKNQARLQKAAFDANAPNPDDDDLPSGPVDSDEEKDAVMAAIARSWGGRPIFQPTIVPLRKKYEFNRFKGVLSSALGNRGSSGIFGSSGGGFFSAPAAPVGGPTVDANGVIHARKGSVIPGARSMMAPASSAARKGSAASVVAT